uniref:Uncharacterized protein n=1 Tax=Arundo donax TaxID=35708 RepID=A0A0A8YTU6_ARUDO
MHCEGGARQRSW